jgi:hypothetical protein
VNLGNYPGELRRISLQDGHPTVGRHHGGL